MNRISRYSSLKSRAVEMASYVAGQRCSDRSDISKVHAELKNCANYLVFHDYFSADQVRLVKAHTCKVHLLCPFCAARRAAKALEKNLSKVHQVIDDNPHLIPVVITFTVKNGHDLTERFIHLKNAFKRLRERSRDALRGKGVSEFVSVQGGMHSYEVTYNDRDGWHPHIHLVALVERYVDHSRLSKEWHDITGDSFVVGISKIRKRGDQNSIVSAMLEVFKYAVKFSDLTPERCWEAYQSLRGRRLIDSFGLLRGVQMPDALTDDPLENLPYLELVYRFRHQAKAYDLTSTRLLDPTKDPTGTGRGWGAPTAPQ